MFKTKRKARSRSKVLKYKQQSFTKINKKRKFKKQSNSKFQKYLLRIILVAISIGALFYVFYFSSVFSFNKVIIKNQTNLNQKIEQLLFQHKGENIFKVNLSDLEEKIKYTYTEINTVSITKKLPSTLIINIEEFPKAANIINESKTLKKSYVINQVGYIIKEDSQNKTLPYIKIKSDEPINPESQIISEEKLSYILDSMEYFEDKFGMKIIEANYKINAREVHLLTEKSFYLWLDITKPFENQLKKLKKILVKLDIYNELLSYIDLRIEGTNGEKIIYKRR